MELHLTCLKCGKPFTTTTTPYIYAKGKHQRYCSSACAHSRTMNEDTRSKIRSSMQQYYAIESRRTPLYKIYHCANCGASFTMSSQRDVGSRRYCSLNCKQAWLKKNWQPKMGGYRYGAGRGKSGWYKGIFCDSTWELAFVVYHMDRGIDIKRCKEIRVYEYEGKRFHYHPDFIVNDQIFEIKGYKSEKWISKLNVCKDIKVLYKKDIRPYLDYCHDKYGTDLTLLYDGSNPRNNILNQKYCWIHKGDTETWIIPQKLQQYLDNGWIRGRIRKSKLHDL